MKRTKLVLGLAVAALLLLFTGSAAHAQYEPGPTTTTPSTDIPEVTVVRGQTVDVSGTDCAPGAEVVVTMDDGTNLGTFTADDNGSFVTTITIPSSTSLGSHLITATCGDVQQFLRVNVLGESTSTGGSGALPRTGSSNTAPLVGIGAGALVLGAAFVYGSRRPRTT
ncbi:MAG: LPXTG cell wall anchor domain-containing protein [Actinobacteria bacterium]|nr:LPXTG cell wall anchor domain-containing protein [Actinomycetota bacterium]